MKTKIIKLMLTIILLLTTMILIKSNLEFKTWFKINILDKTFSFAALNKKYEDLFGSSMPFKDLVNKTETVFNEKLVYSKKEDYKDGVKLTVTSNYLVPSLEKGLVIHVGTKDDYGLCVIVSQVDNVETMYCNITNVAVKLYDYIDSGMLIGEANDKELILVFKENGQKISYEKYI